MKNPKLYKEEFISDLERAYRIDFEEAKKSKQIELNKKEDTTTTTFDTAPGFQALQTAGQVKLSSLTGNDEDKYSFVIYNDKTGKYEIKKGGEALETGFKPMTMNELRAFVGLTANKEEVTVPTFLDPKSGGMSVEEQAKNLINLYKN